MKPVALLLCLMLFTVAAMAQPTQPILRLENGMNNSTGRRISIDANGKYLLTCGDDKTARLFDAATGQLLNTLRIPIGGTDEGKIFACALSPNGTYAVLAGWTGYEWDGTHSIYVVHTQTGRIIKRITRLPSTMNDLEFSPDGQWLAAASGSGVRIFDTRSWSETKKLEGYGGDVYNVAFDKNNRLATVCYDGKLRLYNNSFELIAVKDNLAGKLPYSVAFNPSGSLLAVGFSRDENVEVRSGSDLSLLYQPIITGTDKAGNVNKLSFSSDGTSLYGGGSYAKVEDGDWKYVLRKWNDAGKQDYTDVRLLQNSVMDIKPLPNGSMAVIGSYPDVAVIAESGKIIWYHAADNNDFAAREKAHLRINNSGTAIGFTPVHQQPLSFDIASRSLVQEESVYPSPTDKNAGTEVTEWGSYNPLVNTHKISLLDYETGYSTDVNSDGKEFILGTSWDIYKLDLFAKQLWKTATPDAAFAVNISGNDKTVVAALGDGTIRWYSMADGAELLAFYLSSDKKRWVLFTPSGYYDASPGAEDMLGWHINNGPAESPSFYPVSRFRSTFYRPDIIDAVLETYSEAKAIMLANSRSNKQAVAQTDIKEKLPPVVTITNPLSGSTVGSGSVTVSYALTTPENAPVKNIKVLINGRPVAVERGVKLLPSNSYTLNLTVPPNDCTITLLAENDNGVSPEANLHLKYKAPERVQDEFIKKPKLYVLTIGISGYQNADLKLGYAAADANGFAAALVKLKGGLYGDVVVKSLIDQNATKDNILDGLEWIQRQTSQQDVAMIFYAGHGVNDNNGIFYMLPVGADVSRLRSTGLNFEELRQTVSNIAGKVVVFIDACHSGNVMGSGRRGVTDINALVNELSSTQNGAITFTSSTGKEYSLEDPSWQHGAFTKALLEGLSGKAAIPGKNKITVKSLDAYVSERVKELTQGKQHPTSVIPPNVPDFPISTGQ